MCLPLSAQAAQALGRRQGRREQGAQAAEEGQGSGPARNARDAWPAAQQRGTTTPAGSTTPSARIRGAAQVRLLPWSSKLPSLWFSAMSYLLIPARARCSPVETYAAHIRI